MGACRAVSVISSDIGRKTQVFPTHLYKEFSLQHTYDNVVDRSVLGYIQAMWEELAGKVEHIIQGRRLFKGVEPAPPKLGKH